VFCVGIMTLKSSVSQSKVTRISTIKCSLYLACPPVAPTSLHAVKVIQLIVILPDGMQPGSSACHCFSSHPWFSPATLYKCSNRASYPLSDLSTQVCR
jgi:hypothetical protein